VACGVPLAIMLISNFYEEAVDLRVAAACIAGMCFPVLLRPVLASRLSVPRLVACSALASLAFFLLSNGAVWLFSPMYSPDLAGLSRCFTNALPFFRNTFAGDLTWTAVLFSAHALLTTLAGERFNRLAYIPAKKP
jgi:hypothetical protein